MKRIQMKKIYILGLIPVSAILIIAARGSSHFAEFYARYIYKGISQLISVIFGLLPFSVSEILLLVLPVVLIGLLIRLGAQVFKDKKEWKQRLSKAFVNILCILSIALFLFVVLTGINYYRYPFSDYSNLEIRASSVEELYALCDNLVQEANTLRSKAKTDENGVFQLSMSRYELAARVNEAMELLSREYPVLAGSYAKAKPVLLSRAMSYTEIIGIFIPYTMESNVNVDISDFRIPSTMLHELTHLRGFMKEDEANFIAYLAGINCGNTEIAYSSTMLALEMSGNALYVQDTDLYAKIRKQYSQGVEEDLRADAAYWQRFNNTVISTVSDKVNDTYLKANNQKDGVNSYGRMVDLLLARFRQESKDDR